MVKLFETEKQKHFLKLNALHYKLPTLEVPFLPTTREGNVFTGVCLSTISLMATSSLLGLVTAQSVRILLECFLVTEIISLFPM